MTDKSPAVQKPTIDNINTCYISNRIIKAGEEARFPCGKTGRYVAIVLKEQEFLTICEVRVFGRKYL